MDINNYDFVVVGAGTMGRSAAIYLSLHYPDAKCALIEQYKFDHEEGSSHSRVRVIRSAYVHPFYRDLCSKVKNQNWRQLQKLLNVKLIYSNPYLAFIQIEKDIQKYKMVASTSNHLRILSEEDVKKMVNSTFKPKTDNPVYYDSEAGIVMAQVYMNRAIEYLKIQKKVDIFEETEVQSIVNDENGVTLTLKSQTHNITKIFAKKISLCCGRWIEKLAPCVNDFIKSIEVTTTYWKMKEPEKYKVGVFPAWVLYYTTWSIFCLPDAEGDGIKFGYCDDRNPEKQNMTRQEYDKIKREFLQLCMEEYFQGRYECMIKEEKCHYTSTRSDHFLIDWTDKHQNVLICSACSGHGFKFSPIIGQIVADLLNKNKSVDLFQKHRNMMSLNFHKTNRDEDYFS